MITLQSPPQLSQFTRPKKVLWIFPKLDSHQQWTDQLSSKSLRNLAAHSHQILKKQQITYQALPLTEAIYAKWHVFYTDMMQQLDHDVIASPTWFQERKDALKKICLLEFRQNDILVGGSIITCDFENTWNHNFKASMRNILFSERNASLGTLMEFIYLEYVFANNAKQVTSGLSRNGFGYFNTLGYLASKLKMGYSPFASPDNIHDQEYLIQSPKTLTAWFVFDQYNNRHILLYPKISLFPSELLTYLQRQQIPLISYYL